jgi:hypothetical protein
MVGKGSTPCKMKKQTQKFLGERGCSETSKLFLFQSIHQTESYEMGSIWPYLTDKGDDFMWSNLIVLIHLLSIFPHWNADFLLLLLFKMLYHDIYSTMSNRVDTQ